MKRPISLLLTFLMTLFFIPPVHGAEFPVPVVTFSELREEGGRAIFYIEFSVPESYSSEADYIKITPLACSESGDALMRKSATGDQIIGKTHTLTELFSFPVPGKKDVYYIKSDKILLPYSEAKSRRYEVKLGVEYYRSEEAAAIAAESEPYRFLGAYEPWSDASSWTVEELRTAAQKGLIPAILEWQDLTQPVTRAEFAAITIRLYETASGKEALPCETNPFSDTADAEVLKAYALGITNGVSPRRFCPDALVNREEVATMLARTMTLASPGLSLRVSGYTKFLDDAKISSWAKQSVYFMAKNNILNGIGNNLFAPRNLTAAETKEHYANATREAALVISLRCYEYLNR